MVPKWSLKLGGIAGKPAPRGVQDRLEDVALISYPSWLPFGTLLGRFFHLFLAFWHRFQLILGPISFLSNVSLNLLGSVFFFSAVP